MELKLELLNTFLRLIWKVLKAQLYFVIELFDNREKTNSDFKSLSDKIKSHLCYTVQKQIIPKILIKILSK